MAAWKALETWERKIVSTVEGHIKGHGEIVEVVTWDDSKDWSVILTKECAALKLFYVYRHSKTRIRKNPRNKNQWIFSIDQSL